MARQLIRDYAAKMHVGGAGHGPSYIVSLGSYEGGNLRVMDTQDPHGLQTKEGEVLLEVKDLTRCWPEVKVGQKLKGTVRSIRRTSGSRRYSRTGNTQR